jgi:phage/plasmid-like protein (TIGR03299 family)
MVANLTIREDGSAEGVFATPPWHNLGVSLVDAFTSEVAIRKGQLDWLVEQVDLQAADGTEAMGWKLNRRGDNKLALGIVGPQYCIVQNHEAFKFMDSLVMDGIVKYESAFSLGGGKQVVLLIRMPKVDEIVAGDTQERFGLLNTSHDGSSEIRFGITTVRVCCQNTLKLAMDRGGIGQIRLRHTFCIHDKLDEAKRLIAEADKVFEEQTRKCRQLAKYRLVSNEWQRYLNIVAPVPQTIDPEYTPQRAKRIVETRTNMDQLFREGEHQQMAGVKGTAWAAYNAVSEYVDALPRRGANDRARSEARFRVVLTGTGHNIKQRAFDTACNLAEVN